ncbi:MAG: cobyric acid synthase [Candidatus Brocadiaceae bacterium]|nr:cobyric acid synthase [Candidatus Brocadiaceae bacterium]
MKKPAIMIQGTGSHVGKSILACALCRILKQDGFRVAPFKAQNMALNSYVTRDGKEMGRAQVAQAEAAGIEPAVEMNPILLKPTGDCGSQVIIMGTPIGNMTAKEYYQKKAEFVSVVRNAYDTLKSRYDIIVIEGAGSPAEINLKDGDIVNMGMAEMASASVLLVTDIDRGGAFAWIVGTLALLTEKEKMMIQGVVFNKFRGDKKILEPGLKMLENRINKPVVGVIPYLHNLCIDDEDSVSLEYHHAENKRSEENRILDIVVIKLPRISNFTDFSVLNHEQDVRVRFVDRANHIGKPDLLIIPGTKNTIGDLTFLKETNIFEKTIGLSRQNTVIIGICGGYQMLGKRIHDPYHVESPEDSIQGLGLLNTVTTFAREKRTHQVKAHMLETNFFPCVDRQILSGYEIHMGETMLLDGRTAKPFARITERAGERVEVLDGCVSPAGTVMGTYIHGIFDNEGFRSILLNSLRLKKGLTPKRNTIGYKFVKEENYNELADIVRKNLNMDMVYSVLNGVPTSV